MKRTPRRRTFPSGRPHGFPRAQESWRAPRRSRPGRRRPWTGAQALAISLDVKISMFFQSTSLPVLMFDDDHLRKRAEQRRISAGGHYRKGCYV
ncbi:hypothetical protein SHO565_53640 [Streptomyces sp. HO565]